MIVKYIFILNWITNNKIEHRGAQDSQLFIQAFSKAGDKVKINLRKNLVEQIFQIFIFETRNSTISRTSIINRFNAVDALWFPRKANLGAFGYFGIRMLTLL